MFTYNTDPHKNAFPEGKSELTKVRTYISYWSLQRYKMSTSVNSNWKYVFLS